MTHRLLILVTDLEIGGTPRVVRDLAIRLQHDGVDLEVACLAKWGPVADEIKAAGLTVTALGAKGAMDWRVFGRLRQLIRQRHITVVYSLLVHANVAAAVAARGQRHVRLFQSIQTTQPRPRWHWWAQAWAATFAKRIIVPTQSVATAATVWSHISRDAIEVIPNAVDAERFAKVTTRPADADPFAVGFLGRLDPIKRIDDLMAAVRQLGDRYRLHIFGDGPERERLQRIADGMRVVFHGTVARPEEAFGQISLLVLPSAAEGFGMVLIEGMAAGIPVIGTDVPGIRDVVEPGVSGLLVSPGNVSELAAAIQRLQADCALRQRLVDGGRSRVAQHYAWEAVLPAYRRVLAV